MAVTKLLIANRSEIAIRVMRAAAELGIGTVAVYSHDDATSLHVRVADEAELIPGDGAAAYLDAAQIVAAATRTRCDAVHPGYGFLSENAAFARLCHEAGVIFVGPRPEMLDLFGDKIHARAIAAGARVPVLNGTAGPTSLEEARSFFESLDEGKAMIIKAVAGGGGRGMRVIETLSTLESSYKRCQSEALAAFGNNAVYVEQLMPRALHIEVQILADGTGAVSHLGERDCTIQRRHQKLVEIAPSPALPAAVRERITAAAVQLAEAVRYNNIGTFEFLVDASELNDRSPFAFIEANPRLQVEHTVSEEVTGVDIVRAQLLLAAGQTLAELGLTQAQIPAPRGFAIQLRVNMETMRPDGLALPAGGTLTAFDPPMGPGVRVDTFGYTGYTTSGRFDSLLAKLIVHHSSPNFEDAVLRAKRALSEFRVEGTKTNISFLRAVLDHPELQAGGIYTRFIDDHAPALIESAAKQAPNRLDRPIETPGQEGEPPESLRAGAHIDANDPLAVLAFGKQAGHKPSGLAPSVPAAVLPTAAIATPDGLIAVHAPLQGTIVSVQVSEGDIVRAGQAVVVMESMKMEHEISAHRGGIVRRILVSPRDTLYEGHPLVFIEEVAVEAAEANAEEEIDLDFIRPDLGRVEERRKAILDENRPRAVERRRATGQRTARTNINDICDPGSFVEYGPLVLAAQARRRSLEELIDKSPTDGMITGVGTVNGDLFDAPASRVALLSYDYTVFAGTQGQRNHAKTDRMVDIAEKGRMPVILFAEGGGGRPGDTDGGGPSRTFGRFPQLSALVPMVGITSGRCFAGNASVLGVCDVIIATKDSNIGMGGPAMIEGGGLGVFAPEDIGAVEIQVKNGVIDILVEDEAEAVQVAKKYLSYFQGPLKQWESADQRLMRRIIPENRLRVYRVRDVIETIADTGSVLEIREQFGIGIITSFIRIEGKPVGVIANNPMHLGGAIDADGADKAARFMQLCDAFDIPILYFCDTPGIMVGPEVEKTALVRHANRAFVIGANVSVPYFTIILRKAYGLGAIAMAGGSYKSTMFTVAWPTGEFGGMGLEGSVKLGYRDDLAAISDPVERKAKYDKMVAEAYERGKALNSATTFQIDDTIDPADSRRWIASLLSAIRPAPPREGKKRPAIDAW